MHLLQQQKKTIPNGQNSSKTSKTQSDIFITEVYSFLIM